MLKVFTLRTVLPVHKSSSWSFLLPNHVKKKKDLYTALFTRDMFLHAKDLFYQNIFPVPFLCFHHNANLNKLMMICWSGKKKTGCRLQWNCSAIPNQPNTAGIFHKQWGYFWSFHRSQCIQTCVIHAMSCNSGLNNLNFERIQSFCKFWVPRMCVRMCTCI